MQHSHPLAALTVAAAALALLGGCAGSAPQKGAAAPAPTALQAALEQYSAYAGPPIDRFTWLGRFYSWEQLGRDRLVVFTTPTEAYLLKVWPSCDLRFVISTVGVSSTGGTVNARLDAVIIDSAPTGHMVCPIDEIRPVDYRRMLADRRAQRNQPPPQSPSPQSPPPATPPHQR
ncbi:MAG TPA: DUF6491 family protein [Steroidobacteraceae bacterium]|nr:DUF6491 family protein [Steroidobacteraceae bacterium]